MIFWICTNCICKCNQPTLWYYFPYLKVFFLYAVVFCCNGVKKLHISPPQIAPIACLSPKYIFSEKRGNKPAPSLATSSRSADVLAEAMASGSFRVKGNTSLRKREEVEWTGEKLGQQRKGKDEWKRVGPKSLIPNVCESLCWKRGAWLRLGVWCWLNWRIICSCCSPPTHFTRTFKAFTQFPKDSVKQTWVIKAEKYTCKSVKNLGAKFITLHSDEILRKCLEWWPFLRISPWK